jgi:hypothetical protein
MLGERPHDSLGVACETGRGIQSEHVESDLGNASKTGVYRAADSRTSGFLDLRPSGCAERYSRKSQRALLRFMGFRDVAEIGLIATLGSLALQLLQSFGLSEELTWRAAVGLLGGLYTAGYFAALRRRPVRFHAYSNALRSTRAS